MRNAACWMKPHGLGIMMVLSMSGFLRVSLAAESTYDPKVVALGLIQQAQAAYEKVTDYTAILVRQELSGGRLHPPERYFLKFRKPFKIYMRSVDITPPRRNIELLYVQGEFDDKVLLHADGLPDAFLPTSILDPYDPKLMERSRHPVTEYGIGHFLERYAAEFQQADLYDELRVFYNGQRQFNGRSVQEVECLFTPLEGARYYCYRSVVYFDESTKLPVRMFFYNWEGQLLGSYAYEDLRVNPGLTDADFDPRNKEYNFLFAPAPREGKTLPLSAVLPDCDSYARVRINEPIKVLIFDGVKESIYYLGYSSKGRDPVAAATQVVLPAFLENKTILLGVRKDGASFRITRVRCLSSFTPEEMQFVEQFAGKPVTEVSPRLVLTDANATSQWATTISAAAQRLAAVLSDGAILGLADATPKGPLSENNR